MARISGVDLPKNKRIEIALTYIYGIGRTSANKILAATGINPDTRVKDLTEQDEAAAARGHRPATTWSKATCAATWQWTSSA